MDVVLPVSRLAWRPVGYRAAVPVILGNQRNGNFEADNGLTGAAQAWDFWNEQSASSEDVAEGGIRMPVTNNGFIGIRQTPGLVAGATYLVRVHWYVTGTCRALMQFAGGAGTLNIVNNFSGTSLTWTEATVTIVNQTLFDITRAFTNGSNGYIYVREVQLIQMYR